MSLLSLVARSSVSEGCTKDTCPASDSIYGYAPNLGASIAFTIIFFLSAAGFTVQTFLYRRWIGFSIALALGTVLEAVGTIARIMLHYDAFSDLGFKLSVVLLTFAPAFLSASIYLLLKQICLTFSPELSRLPPKMYTYIFISCDVVSILLQCAGGAISAIADGESLINIGVDVMVAGLAFQVFTLLVFFLLAAEFFWKVRTHVLELRPGAQALARSRRFRLFLSTMLVAFLCIFMRCCYRVAELSGGWGNPIMREQTEFIVLDAVMIAIAAVLMNVFHPGVFFQRSQMGMFQDQDAVMSNDTSDVYVEAKQTI